MRVGEKGNIEPKHSWEHSWKQGNRNTFILVIRHFHDCVVRVKPTASLDSYRFLTEGDGSRHVGKRQDLGDEVGSLYRGHTTKSGFSLN